MFLFHNIANQASILFSPIVGLIRIIAACVMLNYISKPRLNQRDDSWKAHLKFEQKFYRNEIARGVLEIMCLGPLIVVVLDSAVTLYRLGLKSILSKSTVV